MICRNLAHDYLKLNLKLRNGRLVEISLKIDKSVENLTKIDDWSKLVEF